MSRINATRAEHAARVAKAAQHVATRNAHYAQAGVWETARAALEAERDQAIAAGNTLAAKQAKNSLLVLNLSRPR